MKFVTLLICAVSVYAVVAACALWPSSAASAGAASANDDRTLLAAAPTDSIAAKLPSFVKSISASADGLPFRACGMQIQRVDWIDKYKKSIDEIAAVGADTVKFVVDARQENGKSSRIYLDLRMTPTPDQLADLIQHAKQKKLKVILMPIVLLDAPVGNEWRGTIAPESWDEWWESYRAMLSHFSWIAELNHVDMLVIGSELVSTEQKIDEWTDTIVQIRKTFHGRLTYSSNWDHYTSVPFWNQLDMVGMNSYWKMTDDAKRGKEVSSSEIKQHWAAIQKDLLPWVKKTGKPLMFLEIGWFSQQNAAAEPWDYTKPTSEEPIDLDLQKRLYEGFFESWYGQPMLGGFSIWEWTPGDGGPTDAGYTPENKPAEGVLKNFLAKGPWEVKIK